MNPSDYETCNEFEDEEILRWYYEENPTESLEACDQWKVERDKELDHEKD